MLIIILIFIILVYAGIISTGFLDGKDFDARFKFLNGITITKSNSELYVIDSFYSAIRMTNLLTKFVNTTFQNSHITSQSYGISFNSNETYLYVSINQGILEINIFAKISIIYNSINVYGFLYYSDTGSGLSIDKFDNIYISNALSNTIRLFSLNNMSISTLAGNGK